MKRILIIIFVVISSFLALLWYKNSRNNTQTKITTARVKRMNFSKVISSSGKTKADKSVTLKFQASGKLTWVGVKEGDEVSAYQAIATLDTREVQKNLEKALRDYANERNDFEETWRVTYGGKKPTDALTDTVKRILEKNQWDLERAVLDVELKHLAVEYSTLISPIAGIVTHIDTPIAGVNITPATAVFEIVDPTNLIFEAKIDEIDIGGIQLNQPVIITLDAFPDKSFSGKITFIAYTSEVSSGGATVFPVKISFDSPQSLRVGLNGDISIETENQENVLTIPLEAIREDKQEKYVYKKTKDKYEKTSVSTGIKNKSDIVILSGLTEDDLVVTKGFSSLPKISN